MGFSIRKTVINGRIMTVVNQKEFETMDESSREGVAIEIGDYVYPYYKSVKNEPSCTMDDFAIYFIKPLSSKDKEEYSSKKIKDFSEIGNFKDYLDNVYALEKDQRTSLTYINKTYTIPIQEEDNPEVKLIKQAINSKHIDNESYKSKFSSTSDFNNDTRSLNDPNNHNISFYKLVRDCEAYDIDAILILKDKPNAVNPMGKEYKTYLTRHEELGEETSNTNQEEIDYDYDDEEDE